MQIYNEENKCSKCGGNASVEFNLGENVIERKCTKCGNIWNELPLDSKKINENDGDNKELLLEKNNE